MPIDAVIVDVRWNEDGTATLKLAKRDARSKDQPSLYVVNPPPQLGAAVGVELWSDPQFVYVGGKRWAQRLTGNRVRLLPKKKDLSP